MHRIALLVAVIAFPQQPTTRPASPTTKRAGATARMDLPDLVKKIKPSVATILVYGADGKLVGQGTAFFIAGDRVITNHHVIEDGRRAELKLADGRTVPVAGILADDESHDLVMLSVAIKAKPPPPIPLASRTPREGQRVAVIGSPLGLEQTVTEGIVSSVRELPGMGALIQTTAAISPGSSGSPVLNLAGRVVAVAVSRIAEGQSINFAVAVEHVRDMKPGSVTPLGPAVSPGAKHGTEHWFGVSALEGGKFEEALSHFRRAVAKDPSDAGVWLCVGYCCGELGRHQDAVEAYQRAIRIKPNFAEAHHNLGVANRTLGRLQEAIDAFKQAIRIKPDLAHAHDSLGGVFLELGRWQEAIDALKQAIRIKSDLARAHNNLGAAYVKLGRWQTAIDAYKQAIRIEPEYAFAHYSLGLAYLGFGDKASAFDEYKILKDLDREKANRLFNLIYPGNLVPE